MTLLQESLVFLGAAVLIVPLAKKLGLGAVLGYLIAGTLIGPSVFSLTGDVGDVIHFSELGVVLLLFIIGLELQPSRLWALRKAIFGLGGSQLILTASLLTLAGISFGLRLNTAIVAGLALALSSTAFALQILAEKKQLTSQHGRSSFAILLLQDLAVIPLLAIIPLISVQGAAAGSDGTLFAIAKAVLSIAGVIIVGRLLLRPFLRLVALTGVHEIFSAAALLVVVGTALLMHQVGLSMALGAFLAGVLLADSEYRHELEANIEPFKGLLLGLFFIAVGMEIDLDLIINQAQLVFGLVFGLIFIKATVLYAIGRYFNYSHSSSTRLALVLSQGGEFAFVLLTVAVGAQVMEKSLADLLVVVVSISMFMTPLLLILNEKVLNFDKGESEEREYDKIELQDNRVIIAGFGRFGQIIARTLHMKHIAFTTLESSFEQVDFVRKYGSKVYFGDASRLDLVRSAGADKAEVFVIAVDDVEASVKIAKMIKRHFPHLKIYARARNRPHAYALLDLGVERVVRETFFSSVALVGDVLQGLGLTPAESRDTAQKFSDYDENLLLQQQKFHQDEQRLIASSVTAAKDLEDLFEQDTKSAKIPATQKS